MQYHRRSRPAPPPMSVIHKDANLLAKITFIRRDADSHDYPPAPSDVGQPVLLPHWNATADSLEIPRQRRLRIDVNGRLAGTTLCLPDAPRESAVGWAFAQRYFADGSELGKVTTYANRISIMADGDFLSAQSGPPAVPRSRSASTTISAFNTIVLGERAFTRFNRDDAGHGYIHAALATETTLQCISRDLSAVRATEKLLGWAMLTEQSLDGRLLIVRGIVDTDVARCAALARIAVILTDAVPTQTAMRVASKAGVSIVGQVLSHRRQLFVDAGHIVRDHESDADIPSE